MDVTRGTDDDDDEDEDEEDEDEEDEDEDDGGDKDDGGVKDELITADVPGGSAVFDDGIISAVDGVGGGVCGSGGGGWNKYGPMEDRLRGM